MPGNRAGLETLLLDLATDATRAERDAVVGSIGDDSYLPSMAVVGRIMERTSHRRRFAMPPHLLPRMMEVAGIRLPHSIGAALGAIGASPAVLAAAVVTHVGMVLALGAWLAPSLLIYRLVPAVPRAVEHVTLVPLPYRAIGTGDIPAAAGRVRRAAAVPREVVGAVNQVLAFDAKGTELDSASGIGFRRIVSVLTLKSDVEVRLEVVADSGQGMVRAKMIEERLVAGGILRSRIAVQAIATRTPCDSVHPDCPPPADRVRVRVIGAVAKP